MANKTKQNVEPKRFVSFVSNPMLCLKLAVLFEKPPAEVFPKLFGSFMLL